MNRLLLLLLFVVCMSCPAVLLAQQGVSTGTDTGTKDPVGDRKLNLLKVNLTGLIVKNYSLQYERVL
ncbi:MAG: hypothetical protein EOO01_20420, partial [Chitinophagaceae bacterium]